MHYRSLSEFTARAKGTLAKGPVAVVLVEDLAEVDATLRHLDRLRFAEIVALAPPDLRLGDDVAARVHRVDAVVAGPRAAAQLVNPIIAAAAPGTWLHYCYNAEFLFYPFCESRSVGEMLAFAAEERRDAVLTYVVDLYAGDLDQHPSGVSLQDAHLDRTGYYAAQRVTAAGEWPERQLDFYGGLRWRFEEHIPPARRRIDRISLFRAAPGLRLNPDDTLSEPEMNTYACPWHNNITAALCSFRTAKALKTNPGSRYEIPSFRWHNSVKFDWTSAQLLNLGLMEPGQWF